MKKKAAFLSLISALLISCGDGSAGGSSGPGISDDAQVFNLECTGDFNTLPASVAGVRRFEAYNPLGDGYLTFSGTISTSTETGQIDYQDYSNLAPYEGTIQSDSVGTIPISVLDATGSDSTTMLIYHNVPTTGPPTILGEFTCIWF